MAMVPREKRPQDPEELADYVRRHEYDLDFTPRRRELSDWLFDYNRDQEDERDSEESGRSPLPGHDPQQQHGFIDNGAFSLDQVNALVKSRPSH